MSDKNVAVNEITSGLHNLKVEPTADHPLLRNNVLEDCETAEEAVTTTDSEDYLSEPLR